METTDYIKNRFQKQLDWLSEKAEKNQRKYRILRVITLFCAVSLPFLTGYASDERWYLKVIIGFSGVVIAFVEGLLSLYKYQDNWITYRNAVNVLEREKVMYDTKSGMYFKLSPEDAFHTFVNNAESILANENSLWSVNMKDNKTDKK
jgi:Protein of unknown function (DUF4231)